MCIISRSEKYEFSLRKKAKTFNFESGEIKSGEKNSRYKIRNRNNRSALDSIISEAEKNKKSAKANENFLKSKIEIKDVFGHLENLSDVQTRRF